MWLVWKVLFCTDGWADKDKLTVHHKLMKSDAQVCTFPALIFRGGVRTGIHKVFHIRMVWLFIIPVSDLKLTFCFYLRGNRHEIQLIYGFMVLLHPLSGLSSFNFFFIFIGSSRIRSGLWVIDATDNSERTQTSPKVHSSLQWIDCLHRNVELLWCERAIYDGLWADVDARLLGGVGLGLQLTPQRCDAVVGSTALLIGCRCRGEPTSDGPAWWRPTAISLLKAPGTQASTSFCG